MWSLPGGGLYFGEATLLGGMRELAEETVWKDRLFDELLWYPGTVSTSDSIGDGFHYLIAHCFAECMEETFPDIQAADDAADADWFTKHQIRDMEVVSNCKLN
jgi:ADP-ribose pyrophosphatase YjhB (NUDIX family)